jgi:CHASE1-domain containing sensor protein
MEKQSKQETSRDRFRRLATLRTNLVLKRLKILGNCSNRHVYEYNEKDIDKIFTEIEKKVKEVKAKFYYPKHKEFRL